MRTIKLVEERRQEILEGAMKLFSEKGYDKTSISDIAKYLGISQGLCYRYFESKEEIFEKAVEEYAKNIVSEMIKTITSPNLTLEEKIVSKSNFHDLEKKSSHYKIFHGENTKLLHDCMSIRVCRKLMPYVRAEIDKEIEKGNLKVKDSAMLASCIIYGQFGMPHDIEESAELRSKRMNEFLVDMIKKYKVE